MAVSSVLIIILLVIAAVFVVGFILAYNRRLDRVVSGKERDAHSSLPEPRETAGAVSRIVLLVLAVVIFFSVSTLSGMVSSLKSEVSSLRSAQNDLRRDIWELQQLLEERDRLLLSSDWEVVDHDLKEKTAAIGCSFTLKKYSENTAAELKLGDRTVPLTGDGSGVFRGEFTVGLFEKLAEPQLLVSDSGTTVTEATDLPEYFFWELLPMPSLECRFSSDVVLGKLTYDGSFRLVSDHPEAYGTVTLTYLTGGRDLKTVDVTAEALSGSWIELEKGLKLEKDLAFRIEVETKGGWRVVQQTVVIYDVSADLEGLEYLRILDENGSLLWEDEHY